MKESWWKNDKYEMNRVKRKEKCEVIWLWKQYEWKIANSEKNIKYI